MVAWVVTTAMVLAMMVLVALVSLTLLAVEKFRFTVASGLMEVDSNGEAMTYLASRVHIYSLSHRGGIMSRGE